MPQLKAFAIKYGLITSGNKSQLLSRLDNHLSNIKLRETRVLAIDVGLVNLSFISIKNSLNNQKSILEWDLVDLKLGNYDPVHYTLKTLKLLDNILKTNPTNIIIEAQSWRSGLVPLTILKLKSLEAILVASIISRGYKNVDLVSPKRISDYLVSSNLEFEQGNYRAKKSSSVKLVQKLLDSTEFKGSSGVFHNSSKKDDLADCFLLAYVWNEWRMNAISDLLKSKK